MPQICLIDTDMALDDWMAILYLLQAPQVQVRAITVAATGEAHARPGVQNALRLAALTSHDPDAAYGRETPLRGKHAFPSLVRFLMDRCFFLPLPRARKAPTGESALELYKRHLNAVDDKAIIIALGPLTNLAELLLGAPQLADKIASITMMGGALNVPGNLAEMLKTENTFAEWNLYIDPYAADVVLRSGVPITVVPLDATNQVPLTDAYFERLNTQARSPAAQFVAREVRRLRPLLGKQKFYFWDPLAAVLALHPQIGEYESRRLRVIQDEGRESGRLIDHSEGAEVRVCTRVDAAAFERIFLDTLNG